MKNFILKFFAYVAVINIIVLICCADSESLPFPWVMSGILSLFYLLLFMVANEEKMKEEI